MEYDLKKACSDPHYHAQQLIPKEGERMLEVDMRFPSAGAPALLKELLRTYKDLECLGLKIKEEHAETFTQVWCSLHDWTSLCYIEVVSDAKKFPLWGLIPTTTSTDRLSFTTNQASREQALELAKFVKSCPKMTDLLCPSLCNMQWVNAIRPIMEQNFHFSFVYGGSAYFIYDNAAYRDLEKRNDLLKENAQKEDPKICKILKTHSDE